MGAADASSIPASEGEDGVSGPVMLALSTFRGADSTVEAALEKAKECRKLVIVHVVDVNLARYFIGADIGLYPELKEKCQEDLLEQYRQQAEEEARATVEKARAGGLETVTYVRTGRFALVCLKIAEKERPSLIVTRRSRRPAWVKAFFGSPVDHLTANAGCPVIEA